MTSTSTRTARGFFVVATLDRLDQLGRMLTSLRKHNKEPIMIMLVGSPEEAHRTKTRVGELAPFDAIVMLDIDIFVHGKLNYLFEIAEKGKIGIYREKNFPTINSGVIAMPKQLGQALSTKWMALYGHKKTFGPTWLISYGDQYHLNKIIRNYPIEYLHENYNFLIPEHTLEQELANFKDVKIFHFLRHGHQSTYDSKAYELWLQIPNAFTCVV